MAEGLQQKTGTTYEVARTASERGWLRQLCWWRGRREPQKIGGVTHGKY